MIIIYNNLLKRLLETTKFGHCICCFSLTQFTLVFKNKNIWNKENILWFQLRCDWFLLKAGNFWTKSLIVSCLSSNTKWIVNWWLRCIANICTKCEWNIPICLFLCVVCKGKFEFEIFNVKIINIYIVMLPNIWLWQVLYQKKHHLVENNGPSMVISNWMLVEFCELIYFCYFKGGPKVRLNYWGIN